MKACQVFLRDENITGVLTLGHDTVLERFQMVNYPIAGRMQIQTRLKKMILVFKYHISIVSILYIVLVSKVKKL